MAITETYLKSFMEHLAFPEEAVFSLLDSYRKLTQEPDNPLHKAVERYGKRQNWDYVFTLEEVTSYAASRGIPTRSAEMLLPLSLSEELHERFRSQGLSETIFWDTMADLRYKLLECRRVYGQWGAAVYSWYEGMFEGRLFALGRLEYAWSKAPSSYRRGAYTLAAGDTTVDVHIPSSGPLEQKACQDSFAQAEAFFRPYFPGKPIPLVCTSWLLAPYHREILPPDSGIRQFMEFFDVAETMDIGTEDLWRIFGTTDFSNPEHLPAETLLQRAYIDRLKKGEPFLSGRGYRLLLPEGMS